MADSINRLPVDSSIPHHQDIAMVNQLFEKHGSTMENIMKEFRNPLIYTIIFIILSSSFTSRSVNYLFPSISDDPDNLFSILVKAFAFLLIVYVVQNYTRMTTS